MTEPLLASVRVLDLGGAESDTVGRLYADLGADVLKIEPPGGRSARQALPTVARASIPFRLNNANKRCAVLDPADPDCRRTLLDLASTADIVIDSGRSGGTVEFGTSCAALAQQFSHLVVLSVTDFGADGPYACWQATDPVLYALSTALSRTGPTAGAPVLPPAGLASGTAAAQAAWAALAAYYRRLRTGTGEYIDFSRFEAVLQSLDPPFGSEGQAAVGVKKTTEIWRGRPRNQNIYPIFACKDGHVRICLLSPRQWRGMRAWLGEPERFADPEFDTIAARYAASDELNTLIGDFVATQTMEALVAEGQARGVPIAAVLTPTETLASEHFGAVGALTTAEFAPGADVVTPVGPFVVDGHHRGLRRLAPDSGADEPVWATPSSVVSSPDTAASQRPFDGMRILDLGVIVAGGELGRLFADLGAEVIKIESAAYPDGLRQAPPGQVMSRSWALTHRNEESLGIDLRTAAGAGLFSRLVTGADAVFANFKPGTLASLGFSYDRLRELNPRIVLAESSAFGATGPWSGRMGYGPLVRATTGVTSLWASADGGFYDATTIFPDHVSARLTAIAALAALIRRDRSGEPAHVHVSQAEAAISQLATRYVAESARAAGLPVADDTAAHHVYPCAGDDEWCVISLRSEADHAALESITGGDTAEWTRTRDKTTVARTLQDAGIAAAPMNRAVDVPDDPQVRYRKLYSDMVHPLFDAPMLTETGPAPYTSIPPARLRPAPMPGQQTRRICRQILDISAEETDRLIAEGTLFAYRERP
ncbi:CoA transferase [Mycolicibacterium novocastrense]|uniref:CoA transferase n=1 Tax=Mycolicibacterium novocastrense TaxID=59813 RepID=A0AAW5SSI1_MYCNV|nr:CoA transferase [Mycolicibacterium novocastrense]MCV7026794.1 CoA transferase [Mycolicibacterium novocastrense]GAT10658.1 putative acyl-CoA transferase/carnitine dehydratase [Mycolicibacterium novocastrense]